MIYSLQTAILDLIRQGFGEKWWKKRVPVLTGRKLIHSTFAVSSSTPTIIMHGVKQERNVKEIVVQLSLDYNADFLFMLFMRCDFSKPYISTD